MQLLEEERSSFTSVLRKLYRGVSMERSTEELLIVAGVVLIIAFLIYKSSQRSHQTIIEPTEKGGYVIIET